MSNLFDRVRPFALGAALAAVACAASAQVVPESLAGTAWTLAIQGSPPTQLTIDSQAGPGAPGNGTCRNVAGILGDSVDVPVEGFYCPGDHKVQLLHKNIGSRNTVRVFTAEVFLAPSGQLLMRGFMGNHASAFGDLGHFPFAGLQIP